MAAGYLWAVLVGDGIRGLKGVRAVSNANSFPDANVVFGVALFAYGFSPFGATYWSNPALGRHALSKWFGATAPRRCSLVRAQPLVHLTTRLAR